MLASDGLWVDAEEIGKRHKSGMKGAKNDSIGQEDEAEDVGSAKARSVMIFVSKCRR